MLPHILMQGPHIFEETSPPHVLFTLENPDQGVKAWW